MKNQVPPEVDIGPVEFDLPNVWIFEEDVVFVIHVENDFRGVQVLDC